MSTDKRKPIPSPKHTLDDVLKTLQDLVRNELADEHVGRGRPPRATSRLQEDFADDARARSPATPWPAHTSEPTPSQGTTAAQTTVAAQADTDIGFSSAPPSARADDIADVDADAAVRLDGGIHHADMNERGTYDGNADAADLGAELSTLFADDVAGTSSQPSDANEAIETARAGTEEDSLEKRAHSGPEQTHINWDDIPVLSEVVDLPTQTEPAAPNARTVAVRVVARLNIELREAGTAPLDPAIIDRLERLLREALDPNAAPGEP